jgi:site-specific DNA-methyltransferase (adenine-specific)
MGMWTGKSTEICLIATKGKGHSLLKSRKERQLIEAVRREHSQKPDEVRDAIVRMFGNISRIELFARQKYEGWHVWGNEVESNINMDDYN